MCGICFVCSLISENSPHADDEPKSLNHSDHLRQPAEFSLCTSLLHHRGPDASLSSEVLLPENFAALMQGCVLHLRGDLTPQPITNSKGNALLWNGEIFGGIEVKEQENDTQVLFDMLDSCTGVVSILEVFQKLNGPWAVIYWQADANTLWFGRDMFGRRSLLWHLPENEKDNFVLSSVALDERIYKEIPSVGIFSMDFSYLEKGEKRMSSIISRLPPIVLHPWLDCRWPGTSLYVQKTHAEDLIEFLYPNSPNSSANFSISNNDINRWIPTMSKNLSKTNGENIEDCFMSPNKPNTKQNLFDNSSSISKQEVLQTSGLDLKSVDAVLEKEFDADLGNIWEEQKDLHALVQQCTEALQKAVDIRVKRLEKKKKMPKNETIFPNGESSARVAVLFSGGLDSTLLAALADRCLPEGEPIDLLNVAFEQPAPPILQQGKGKQKKPGRQNRKSSHQVKCGKAPPETDFQILSCKLSNKLTECVSISGLEGSSSEVIPIELHSANVSFTTAKESDLHHLTNAGVPSTSSNSYKKDSTSSDVLYSESHCSSNPMFSQTGDPTLSCDKSSKFSCFSDEENLSKNLESKQELNSATHGAENFSTIPNSFSVQHISKGNDDNKNPSSFCSPVTRSSIETKLDLVCTSPPAFDPFDVPDRQTGRTALSELNPKRKWNFVEINVTQAELQSVRQSHISRLIYPLRTVLDDSIGCAVWFAARGKGTVNTPRTENGHQDSQAFHSQAQVLLCGMAADELFAGYSRHRATFNKEGWSGLEKEIEEELWRISARNLGRDDRIIADHGKEARFPYLDENFVEFVSKIPLHKRVDLNYPRGIGEKLLLRLCAHSLGLVRTACQAKRAIQFGSKIAKLDSKKEKGSDVCDRLL
ncbi:asparagine synthetase domain-containing protein 1 [Elysia marginata]|uniref:Asparagine synthetase domain-containing protein 1 n=1 Tax=Elysia marginata TaxID=1093978 RepID=A0AAV4JUU9_9GAST|nr:asparagine synthetase domain-containing protein 1 [Elysia marginata]